MQKCDITGKGKQFGRNVSHAKNRTPKVWKPNLQTKTVLIDDKKIRMKLSTQAIRTLKQQGKIINSKNQTIQPANSPATEAAKKIA